MCGMDIASLTPECKDRSATEPAVLYASPRHMVDELLGQGCGQEEIVRQVMARRWGAGTWDSLFGTRRRFVTPDEYERVLEAYIETHDPSVVSSGEVGQALEGVGVTHSFECDNLLLLPPDRFVTSTFDIDWKAMETLAAFICHQKLNSSTSLSWQDFQPMLNESRVAVWEARKTFDPYGTARFSTYASRAIKNHLIDYVHREKRNCGIGEITDIDLPDSSRDPALLYDGGYEELLAILRRTPNADLLIQYAMGFDDDELGNPATIRQRRKRTSDRILATIAARN